MSWDAANRALTYGTALTNGWRGDGLRGEKTNSSGTTLFLYDGGQPVMEENSSGATVAINTFGPTGFLARTSSTRTLVYTFDLQGNASQQYNAATGALVESYLFDAYGNRQYSGGDSAAIAEPFSGYEGGAGYYTDWETGSLTSALALCTHRYYDPSAGRFLNRDPILWQGGINLYGYISDRPTGGTDASGLDEWRPITKPGAGVGAGKGCVGAIGGVVVQITIGIAQGQPSQSLGSDLCQCLVACAAGAACGAMGAINLGGADEITPIGAAILGCALGAMCSAMGALQQVCTPNPCSGGPDPPTPCDWLVNSASGCLSGALEGVMGAIGKEISIGIGWIIGGGEGVGTGVADQLICHHK